MGQPKALLPFRGGTFLSTLAATLAESCDPVFAVFGHDAQRLVSAAPSSVIPVENPDYRHGMLTSLQAALRAMPSLPERVLFTLVDHPAIAASTVQILLASDGLVTIPKFAGKRGHPVVITPGVANEILAASKDCKLNAIMDRHAHQIHYIEVNDPAVCQDIDDPRLYRELLDREGAPV